MDFQTEMFDARREISTRQRDVTPALPSLSPLIPSPVFDTYWRFAAERQAIFYRRLSGFPAPWTKDPILQEHKFTNAYRASDRVSQFLIRSVIYTGEQSPKEIFFRILVFKLFNKIETWQLLEEELGQICWENYSFDRYDPILTGAIEAGDRIYSAAYIMPSAGTFGHARKHRNHLRLIEMMMAENLPERLQDTPKMCEAFHLLRSYPSIGDFLAYQLVTDINYSEITDYDEMEFVVPGPGARDGIRKCFLDLGGLSEAEVIRIMAERQQGEFERLGLSFQSLWGRPLQLIDCQNLFCEVDKYARVAHPEVAGRTGRTRIKQKYRASAEWIRYWYPPKWNLNGQLPTFEPEGGAT